MRQQQTLRALRITSGHSAIYVARKLKIPLFSLLIYETNTSRLPYEIVDKITKFYNISIDDISFRL